MTKKQFNEQYKSMPDKLDKIRFLFSFRNDLMNSKGMSAGFSFGLKEARNAVSLIDDDKVHESLPPVIKEQIKLTKVPKIKKENV